VGLVFVNSPHVCQIGGSDQNPIGSPMDSPKHFASHGSSRISFRSLAENPPRHCRRRISYGWRTVDLWPAVPPAFFPGNFPCRHRSFNYRNYVVRKFLPWILLIGVFIGLHARVIGKDPCEVAAKMHCSGESGPIHNDNSPCDTPHDKDCPAEHHHHVACSHTSPSSAEFDDSFRLAPPRSIFLGLSLESEIGPDGPFLSEDKPPLI